MITLTLKDTQNGDMVDFEGAAPQMPGRLQGRADADRRLTAPPAFRVMLQNLGMLSANPL
jgi:hypothetical protein